MRERHTLRDTDWNRVRHAFRRRTRVGRPSRDPRQILDGVCWILATGAPWRDLPSRFGPWQTVYGRFALGSKTSAFAGCWSGCFAGSAWITEPGAWTPR